MGRRIAASYIYTHAVNSIISIVCVCLSWDSRFTVHVPDGTELTQQMAATAAKAWVAVSVSLGTVAFQAEAFVAPVNPLSAAAAAGAVDVRAALSSGRGSSSCRRESALRMAEGAKKKVRYCCVLEKTA